MEEIQLTHFQKDINTIINAVIHSHRPVLISDKGKFLVKIVPVASFEQASWLGCMRGTGKIVGDIVSPAEEPNAWEVFNIEWLA